MNSIVGEKKFEHAADWIKWYRKEAATFEVNPEATQNYRKENRIQDLFVKAYTYFYGIHIFSDRFVFVIDTSASMATTTDGISSINRAKQTAIEIVDRLGSDDRVTVLQVASKPKPLT